MRFKKPRNNGSVKNKTYINDSKYFIDQRVKPYWKRLVKNSLLQASSELN